MGTHRPEPLLNRFLQLLAVVAALLLVLFLVATIARRTWLLLTPSVEAPAAGVDVLERANDAVASVELLLSFLEGASVLVGLGLGAATIYGLRSARETREELSAEVGKIEAMRGRLDAQLAGLERFRPYLENLTDLRRELEESQRSLEQTIHNVALLLQADQEFRLKNYDTAYAFATQVLRQEPENPMALYIAGWLEVQHLRDRLDDGIAHLEAAARLTNWPTARAAYGVGLRRKARGASGEERQRLFWQAEGVLKEALSQSPRLMDFEGESFWGPVGGILREIGHIDGAIDAYEKALAVTPDSSYPWGNLATLYLAKAREANGDPRWQQKALAAFANTVRAANSELAQKPNNYYLLMDVAQSSMMLGQQDPASFARAHQALAQALAAEVSLNSLETSRRGWQDLLESCPTDWEAVRAELQKALATLDAAIHAQTAR